MKASIFKVLTLCCALLFCFQNGWAQEERILNYEVILDVNKDRSIKVREEITVNVTGDIIKRGITRSLPRSRTYVNGNTKSIRYNISKIQRDGQPESYHSRNVNGMEILYLGNRDVYLKPGEYHYTIEYTVPHQVEQLEEIDEIYWNAIGHEVKFPIDRASCLVRLPTGGKPLQKACYTGRYGATENNCEVKEFNKGNELYFQSTKGFSPREGMTIGVGFEKGLVNKPSILERFGSALLLGLVSLGLLIYFATTWNKYGVDPPKPTPYPLFASPKDYSPSSISYIAKESYETNKITASVIDLAIKGYLRIDERASQGMFSSKANYTLTKLKQDYSELYPEEKALMQGLFSGSDVVQIDGEYQSNVKQAYSQHQNNVLAQHEAFVKEGNNRQFLVLPIIVSFLAIIAAVFLINRTGTNTDDLGVVLFSAVLICLPILLIFTLITTKGKIPKGVTTFLFPVLFFIMFSGAAPLFMGLSELKGMLFSNLFGASLNIVALGLFVPLALIALFIYAYLIKRPTEEKLQLQSEIEGFKMYLEMAEKDRMNLLNPPDRTPQHFEAMLPYAFALGVEHKWSSIFKSILEAAAYQPNWSNNRNIYTTHHFSSNFGNSMVQSSTPPPPKNGGGGFGGGSGGGGFSGGGGGGGGVGGW